MTHEQATFLSKVTLSHLTNEIETTYRVLAAVPDETSSYQPHDTCMSGLKLAQHIAGADVMFLDAIVSGAFTKPDESAFAFEKASEVAAAYQRKVPELLEKVKSLTPEQLTTNITFHTFNMPAVAYLSLHMHMVHHRGQLTAYLRPMGARVPSIYGGSADEPFSVTAEA
ncbi:MAG: DinB family protein [Bryobacteraceae bacterium]